LEKEGEETGGRIGKEIGGGSREIIHQEFLEERGGERD